MNWGGFAGGFAQGFQNGVSMGKTLHGLQKERQLQQIREQGIAEAQAAQAAEIDKLVKSNPSAAPQSSDAPQDDAQPVQTGAVRPAEQGITPPRALDVAVTPAAVSSATPPSQAQATPSAGTMPATPQAAPVMPAEPQPAAAPAAQGLPQMPFSVGDKGFKTREEALAYAKTRAPSVSDYFYKTVYPKMQEQYIANGEVEKAEQLQTFIEGKRGKEAVKSFSGAMQKLMFSTDVNGGVQALGDYYNKFIDDGVDFTKGEVDAKDPNVINVTVKHRESGKETVMPMSKSQIMRMGMAYDPTKLVAMGLAQVEKQEEAAIESAKEDRKFRRDVLLKDREYGYKQAEKKADREHDIEKLTLQEQLKQSNLGTEERAKIKAKVDALKGAGYSDDFINGALPEILGVGQFKKATSPEEARRLAHSDRMKSDPTYARKDATKQQEILDQDMKLIYGGAKPTATPQSAPAPANPAAGGLPPQATAKPKGVPVYDAQTGRIIYR